MMMELHWDFSFVFLIGLASFIATEVAPTQSPSHGGDRDEPLFALLFSSSAREEGSPRCFPREKLHFSTAGCANVYLPGKETILFMPAH
ncbi:hypothetical protein JF515_13805 [Alcanivorax marinus]|nr:hypothetical protein [Alloalcanivorax marinus]